MRNHCYLLGPMFVDCQSFAGSGGRNFVGACNCVVAVLYNTIHYIVKRSLTNFLEDVYALLMGNLCHTDKNKII